jgi:hypothetical protein
MGIINALEDRHAAYGRFALVSLEESMMKVTG